MSEPDMTEQTVLDTAKLVKHLLLGMNAVLDDVKWSPVGRQYVRDIEYLTDLENRLSNRARDMEIARVRGSRDER